MTDALIVYDDAQLATRDALRLLLADRAEPEAEGVVVSTLDHAGVDAPLPHVKVALVGSSRSANLAGSALLRVSVWHRDEGLALRLAALCEGLLLRGRYSPSGSPVPVPGGDPNTRIPLAFTTITARLRPRQLE